MSLTIRLIQIPDNIILDHSLKIFVEEGGSIGRAEHCEIYLPDESHQISKIHALVHFRDDMYFLTDVSTNGVFVNSETAPIGKGNTKQILEGERYRVGEYLLQASYKDLQQTVDSVSENIMSSGGEHNDEIEALLQNNDDISDLLDLEVNTQQIKNDTVVQNESKNVDSIIKDMSSGSNKAVDIESLTDDADEIAKLLNPIEDDYKIDVMAGVYARSVDAEIIFENILAQLDIFPCETDQQSEFLAKLREQIVSSKDQIIGSN